MVEPFLIFDLDEADDIASVQLLVLDSSINLLFVRFIFYLFQIKPAGNRLTIVSSLPINAELAGAAVAFFQISQGSLEIEWNLFRFKLRYSYRGISTCW